MGTHRSALWRYAIAIVAVALALLVRLLLNPVLDERVPFATCFLAVIVVAWYGGLIPALVSLAVSALLASILFVPEQGILWITRVADWIALVLFVGVSVVIILLTESIRRSQQRAEVSRRVAIREREEMRTTLMSLGDAVIVTDERAQVTALNPVAEKLTGWRSEEAVGRPLDDVFSIRNEMTGEVVENPVNKVLQENAVVELANHTQLIDRQGGECPIEDSAAPIRDEEGNVLGVVLIFRDGSRHREIEQRRAARLAVTQTLATTASLEAASVPILRAVCDNLGWDIGSLWMVDDQAEAIRHDEFYSRDARGSAAFESACRNGVFGMDSSLPGRVWQSGQAQWIADVAQDADFVRAAAARHSGLHGAFACPVFLGQKVLGVIEFFSREIRQPDDDLLEMMTTLGGQLGQFIERVRAQEGLREHLDELADGEQRLRSIVDHVVDGIITIDDRGTVQALNPAAEQTFGYRAEEVVGQNVRLLMPEPYHGEHDQYIARYLRTGEARIIGVGREVTGRRKDGSTFPMELGVSQFTFKGRRFFTGLVRDITDRKRTEHTTRFLADASRSLAMLVDSVSTMQRVASLAVPFFADWCAVHMPGEDGQLRQLAVAHADPAKVQLAKELGERFPSPPDAAAGSAHVFRTGESELLADIPAELLERLAQSEEHLEIIRRLGLKSYIGVPIKLKDRVLGTITFVTAESSRRYTEKDRAVAEDLAHRAAIAVENERLYGELRDEHRRKDEFLAMLAHELRNPLAPISSGLEALALRGIEPQSVAVMQEQLQHLVRLVDDLLDVSRIMRGRIQLRKERTDVGSVAQHAVETVRSFIETQEQTLAVSLPAEPVVMEADSVRLAQVIINLLNNAAKYTPAGGHIWLTLEREGESVRLSVRDNGLGIDRQLLPHVFDLFTQSDRSLERSQGGLGIGLTLVRNLVEMHGGTVTAHSDGEGQGSEFVVRMPALPPQPIETPPPVAAPAGETPRRVLIVDDNVAGAQMLGLLLNKLGGHEIQLVHDGAAAIDVAQAAPPEIILLDIGLPQTNGYEVAEQLRKNPQLDATLIVALTGYGAEEDRRRSMQAGFDLHLVKPPSLNELQEVFRHQKLQTSDDGASRPEVTSAETNGDETTAL